jgi:hypothetical protein
MNKRKNQFAIEEPREVTGGGGGEWEPNQVLLQEPANVPSSNPNAKTLQEGDENTNQPCENCPLEDTNATKKE